MVVVVWGGEVRLWIWLVVEEAWSQGWWASGGFVDVVVGKRWRDKWVWVGDVDTLALQWEQVEIGC